MYWITNINGGFISNTETPVYIKKSAAGSFVFATEDEAIGIAFNGNVYNLYGHEEIEDAETVVVNEFDSGQEFVAYSELVEAISEGVNGLDR